ncbi:MAG: putative replicase protein [Suhnsivirus montiscola]|uniref:RNA-directed RNA polymerase n=1 Tax=Leviviridae sp. TaxID=2027243 RepID=A0ABY3SUY8_9VIRU|nr:MAG: putative replicase protein [Leviviridae sp.]
MRRCEVHSLQGVLESLLRDYLKSYPSDTEEVERDISRLSLLVQTRGRGVFLLDLPALGKHFDRCLSDGVYSESSIPLNRKRWPDSPLPRFLSGVLLRVFERNSGRLRSDVDINVVSFLRQIYYFAKGYEDACSKEREAEAVSDFYRTDREVRIGTLSWSADRIDLERLPTLGFRGEIDFRDFPVGVHLRTRWESGLYTEGPERFQSVCDYVASRLGLFSPFTYKPRHGPGAVSDLRSNESKYSLPNWTEKLDRVFPFADFAFANYAEWADTAISDGFGNEAPSKLTIVPKSAKSPRLIASEPTSHMWCQQTILKYLLSGIERTSLRNSISLNDQEPSRVLALEASKEGRFATIDLSSASDRLSTWLVERVFRRNSPLIEALHAARTRHIVNGTGYETPEIPKGSYPLNKFVTQGTACTFPVQSIVFALICISAIIIHDNQKVTGGAIRRASKMVRVFGDDIIIPTRYDEAVRWLLTVVGLKVNHDKSFSVGNFRESCGMDAFRGYDVTPQHLNTLPDTSRASTLMSAVDCSNNFFRSGYWQTAAYIESTLPRWVQMNLPVVAIGSGRTGLESFCGADVSHLRKVWHDNYQQWDVKTVVLSGKTGRHAQTGQHDLFQYFTEEPAPDTIWEPGRARVPTQYLRVGRVPMRYYLGCISR